MSHPESTLPTALRAPTPRFVDLLLQSRIPARLSWIDGEGRPVVAPLWFTWTGDDLVVSTFAGSRKATDLTDGSWVAVSIDNDEMPYRSVRLRGPVTTRPVVGLTEAYREAAARYLGAAAGADWCERIAHLDQVEIRIRPVEASVSDMGDAGFLTEPVPARGDG